MNTAVIKFEPDKCQLSQSIQNLTPDSSEAEIKEAFIKWNREVLMPIIDSVLPDLENVYEPLTALRVIRDQRTAERKDYIGAAINTLKIYRAIYGTILERICEDLDLQQFLSYMGMLEPEGASVNWANVTYGMNDAEIPDELWPAVTFRYNEARRILYERSGSLVSSYKNAVRREYEKYESSEATKNLEDLGEDDERNAEIIYTYFQKSLMRALYPIFDIDKRGTDSGELFDISPHCELTPDITRLLQNFSTWGQKVKAFLARLPEHVKRHPDYAAYEKELLSKIELLEPCIQKLCG